jgi:RHS repeat-associated protein/uncharacterized repeat protein (TIGR01451 family)
MTGVYKMSFIKSMSSSVVMCFLFVFLFSLPVFAAAGDLAYSSYVYVPNLVDINFVVFSYENGTELEVYESDGITPVLSTTVLDKGEHIDVDQVVNLVSGRVYLVAGSNPFAVLNGDAIKSSVSGYYAMDLYGRGTSREFYTYTHSSTRFIIFAYEAGTAVTVEKETLIEDHYEYIPVPIGDPVPLGMGNYWIVSHNGGYFHITANKPVSALLADDTGYFVPSADGRWCGKEFYTYVDDFDQSDQDITVFSYNDGTVVTIRDNTGIIYPTATDPEQLNSGEYAYVCYHWGSPNQYLTITSNKDVTVSVEPWMHGFEYHHGVFVPDRSGTGIGTDFIATTASGGYLNIVAHKDETDIRIYNLSAPGTPQVGPPHILNKGETVNANYNNVLGFGIWRIVSDKAVSVYAGCLGPLRNAAAEFAPLNFSTVWDIQDYEDTLFSGSFNSSLFDLKVYENPIGTIYDFASDNTDFGIGGNIYELEVFDDELYMCIGNTLYTPTVTVDGEDVSVTLGAPVWQVSTSGDEIISMLATDTMLLMGTGVEATNSYYDTSTLGIQVSNDGSSFTNISAGLEGSGVQCLLGAEGKDSPPNITLGVTAQIEQAGSFVDPTSGYVTPLDTASDEVRYTINCASTGQADATNMILFGRLPEGTNFVSAESADGRGIYDESSRSVIWYFGDATSPITKSYNLQLILDEKTSLPGDCLKMLCWIENDIYVLSDSDESVNVGCWGGDIIYVNSENTSGNYNGVSWETAFSSLEQALSYVSGSTCPYTQIWVAGGQYVTNKGFVLPDNIAVFGSFAGYEASMDDRSLTNPLSRSVLTGVGLDTSVVIGADNATLDGFTVTGGKKAGIYCDDTSPAITRCRIVNNGGDGIYCTGAAAPEILNNWIADNGDDGVELASDSTATIRNNTIVYNGDYGIYNDSTSTPTVINSILWGNDTQLTPDCTATYSCIQGGSGGSNIGDYPEFKVDGPSGDYHLMSNSPCISNPGDDSGVPEDETDIDGQQRKVGAGIDRGADERPPVEVYAGANRYGELSVDTDIAKVTFDDAVLSDVDPAFINTELLTVQWDCLSGPAAVNWNQQQDALNPTFIFSEIGLYVLKLAVLEDGAERNSDIVCVRIGAGLELSYSPDEPQCPDITLEVSDYSIGELPTANCYVDWDGPFGVPFDPPHTPPGFTDLTTQMTVYEPSIYQISAKAFNGPEIFGGQVIWVPVNPQDVTVKIVAEPETITWPDNRIHLSATVVGAEGYTFKWLKLGADKNLVHFGELDSGINSIQTDVIFDKWGDYNIGLVVLDEWDCVVGVGVTTLTVNPPSFSCLIVDAGPNRTIDLSQDFVFLAGSVEGDNEMALTYEWLPPVDDAGNSLVDFTPEFADQLSVKALFETPAPGDYTFGLLAKYDFGSGEQPVGLDEVTITVIGEGDPYEPGIGIEVLGDTYSGKLLPGGSTTLHLTGVVTDSQSLVDYTKNEWSCYSPDDNVLLAPGEAVRGSDVITQPIDVTFSAPGEYPVGLIVRDAGGKRLASALAVISITTEYFTVTVESDKSEVTLLNDAEVHLTATVDSFDTEWKNYWAGWTDTTGTVEFRDITFQQTPTTLTSTATAELKAIGTFFPEFVLKAGGENGIIVGSGNVKITVNSPDIIVTAKAGSTENTEAEGPYAVVYENDTLTVFLDGVHTPINGTLTYQWRCTGWPAEMPAPPQPAVPAVGAQSQVDLDTPGTYKFQMSVYADLQFVGSGEVEVIVLSGRPVASVGSYNVGAKVDQPFHLNRAYVLDDKTIIENNITWHSSPELPTSNWLTTSPYTKEKPAVIFTNNCFYDVWVEYTDGDGFSVTSQVETILALEEIYVNAGSPKYAIRSVPLSINDAFTDPPYINLTYKWTKEHGDGTVTFVNPGNSVVPGDSLLCPNVIFDADGEYTLKLTVSFNYVGIPIYLGSDTVEITVSTPEWFDEKEPPTVTSAMINGTAFDSFTETVCDLLNIEVEAEDEHIESIYLELNSEKMTADQFLTYKTEVLDGLPDAPRKLRLTATLDTHSLPCGDNNRTLTAYAKDKAGNLNDPISPPPEGVISQADFETDCMICEFTVNPTAATSETPGLTFSAGFMTESPILWYLDIFTIDGVQLIDKSCSGNSTDISEDISFSGIPNGSYKARLTASDDIAFVYFDVAIGQLSSGLVAQFDDDLLMSEEDELVPQNIRYVFDGKSTLDETVGPFDITGRAYHTVFHDIDVGGTIISQVYYKVVISNSDGVAKNITPGYLDAAGFANGSVGGVNEQGILATIDATSLENGIYTITLIVKCHDDITSCSVDVAIDCPLKLGNVKFSQEDLSIDVGGVPISIVRSYDSFKKDTDSDFGYGWTYSLSNMNIQLNEAREDHGSYTVRSGGVYDRDVTLTLPNGQRATFTPRFVVTDSTCIAGQCTPRELTLVYDSPPGVNASLSTTSNDVIHIEQIGGYNLWDLYWDGYMPLYGGVNRMDRHDFAGYELTIDETEYVFNRSSYGRIYEGAVVPDYGGVFLDDVYSFRACGKPYLDYIKLPSDEVIDFVVNLDDPENPKAASVNYYLADGSLSSQKPWISIEHDPDSGRITKVWTPEDTAELPSLQYEYDGGKLRKVHKLINRWATNFDDQYETTTYEYSGRFITGIKDERGLSPIQYVYDESGKLIATIDAKGNRIELGHALSDAEGTYEEVKDRSGNITKYYYNSRGNVEAVFDALGVPTRYEYDDKANLDSPTVITKKVPDPVNPGTIVDAVTTYLYDDKGRTIKITDPELNETYNYYDDSSGNLIATWHFIPDPTSPSVEVAVVTVNDYDTQDNMLIKTRVFVDNKSDYVTDGYQDSDIVDFLEQVEQTEYHYDGKNRLKEVYKVDTQGTLPTVVTEYFYNQDLSNSPDQPYKTSEPYQLGQALVYTHYYHYNAINNQDAAWYYWDDPANGQGDDERILTITDYDAQGRVIRTRRIIDDNVNPDVPDLDSYLAGEQGLVLSQTVYNSIGKVDYTINENGVLTVYKYDELGNTVETSTYASMADYDDGKDPCSISQMLYDNEGRVIVSVGPYAVGDTPVGTETVYDALGRVVETRRWANVQIDLVDLTVNNKIVGKTVNPDAVIANAWNNNNSDPVVEVYNCGWRSNNKIPVIDTAAYNGDYHELPLSYSRTVYDIGGRVKHSVVLDEDGYEQPTTYYYDKAGKQIKVVDPKGHQNLIYTAKGDTEFHAIDLTAFDDTEGAGHNLTGTHKTVTIYEGTQRKSVTDALGNITEFSYDALGRVIRTKYPQTRYYNEYKTPSPDYETGNTYTHVSYDGLGRKQCQSNQLPQQFEAPASVPETELTYYEYDQAGRLTAVILPQVDEMERPDHNPDFTLYNARPRYEYAYDGFGNLVETRDNIYEQGGSAVYAYQRETKFAYDHLNNQISREMPGGAKEYKEYDELGRLKVHVDFKEQATGYFYNDIGQLQYKCYYGVDSTPGNGTNDNYVDTNPEIGWTTRTEYTYDKLGRKEQVIEARGTTTYHYDAEGRIESIVTPEGTVSYAYDPITGRKINTTSGNTDTDYFYDQSGRLAEVQAGSKTASYYYDEVGNRDYMELDLDGSAGYEIKTDYTYNQMNRLTSIVQQKTGQVGLAAYNYTLKADGMRYTLAEDIESGGGRNITYDYDNLNRVWTESAGSASGSYYGQYTYDVVGNRTQRLITANGQCMQTDSEYNDRDQLVKETHIEPALCYLFNDKPVYAYAEGGQITHYRMFGSSKDIGPFKAFLLGIPTKWSAYTIMAIIALLPIAFLLPVVTGIIRASGRRRRILSLLRQGLIILLIYMLLFDPVTLQQTAQAAIDYGQLDTANWGTVNTDIHYIYDANGSLTKKITAVKDEADPDTNFIDKTVYTYNLQNRLAKVEFTTNGTNWDTTEYKYNDDGIRVEKSFNGTVTKYLIDPSNHTGYAQVLEEWTGGAFTKAYIIGDDVIGEVDSASVFKCYLYDGQGSVRHHADSTGALISYQYGDPPQNCDTFAYDAYGCRVDPLQDTVTEGLFYTGEQYDTSAEMYYLRARYYNPLNGRFNRTDPFAGDNQDPQSLHKYLYCHANPINGIDPSGEISFTEVLTVVQIIGTVLSIALPALITLGASGALGEVLDTPRDAFVVSLSASYIFKALGRGFGGMGIEGTYDMLYINKLGRWQDYWSWGVSAGTTGGMVSIEAGPVWNVERVRDYEHLFFSATGGGAPFDLHFPGLSKGGIGVSVFWAPGKNAARGFKMGPLASTGMLTGSGTISWYTAGGPFSIGKDIRRWFNDNIPAPNLTNVQDVRRFIDSVKEKLNSVPLPKY